jgi:hypothetical protein
MFYILTLICSKLEYASVVWNSFTSADSNKLENIQRKLANLCYNRLIHLCNNESIFSYLYFKVL